MKINLKKFGWIKYEIVLIVSIIMCLSYIIIYEDSTSMHTALSVSNKGNVAIAHDKDSIEEFKNRGWPIIKFNHDSTQFITIYNVAQEEIYQLMLGDVIYLHDRIDSLKQWWPIFYSTVDKGSIDLSSNGIDMIINYEWLRYDDGTVYLLVYNTDKTQDNLFNAFNTICYIALILSFIMFISIIYCRYHGITTTYKILSVQIQEIVNK